MLLWVKNKIIRILAGAKIGVMNKIAPGVMIGEGVSLGNFKTAQSNIKQGDNV